jgi:hypothetical protein
MSRPLEGFPAARRIPPEIGDEVLKLLAGDRAFLAGHDGSRDEFTLAGKSTSAAA